MNITCSRTFVGSGYDEIKAMSDVNMQYICWHTKLHRRPMLLIELKRFYSIKELPGMKWVCVLKVKTLMMPEWPNM